MLIIYGIPNCDKCRAARKWFESQGMEFEFHDLRADGLAAAAVAEWLDKVGADALLNKRSTTWRALSDAERQQAHAGGAAELVLRHPTLIKRPLITQGSTVLVGYDEASWRSALA